MFSWLCIEYLTINRFKTEDDKVPSVDHIDLYIKNSFYEYTSKTFYIGDITLIKTPKGLSLTYVIRERKMRNVTSQSLHDKLPF